jgi:DNA ligase-1
MNFKRLSEYFSKIEKTPSRNEMTEILSKLYSKCNKDEVAIISYLLVGRVAPLFINAEFNIASKSLLEALKLLAGELKFRGNPVDVYNKIGDLGSTAEKIIQKGKNKIEGRSPQVSKVYSDLWEIVGISGGGSVERKKSKIVDMIKRVSPIEAKYIVRILSQELRLGSSSKTVLDALSFSSKGDKRDRLVIERAYGVCSDLGYVAQVYMDGGKKETEKIDITPGIPIASMLVEREKEPESIMKRMKNPIVQPKFDGLRCQIHVGVDEKDGFKNTVWNKYMSSLDDKQSGFFEKEISSVKLYSRNLEDLTEMFPAIVEAAKDLKIKSGIFDSEAVGYNENTQEFATFQSTMIRRRKYNIKKAAEKQPIRAFLFDVLYLNGKNLMDISNIERINILRKVIPEDGIVTQSESTVISNTKDLEKKFHKEINAGLEGIIVKDPKSKYQPGARGFDWIKLKRASQGQLADTVDVVILGYYFGRGRQANFGIGAILGGLYDRKKDNFVTLTKIGTGVTDEEWRTIKKDLDKITLKSKLKIIDCDKSVNPDVWVKPSIVATIEADEITRSPVHSSGRGKDGVGYALRFPRLKVWNRDKIPEDSTSIKELKRMYELSRKE